MNEIDEMIKFEIEAGNPFSEFKSYKSYKAIGRKKETKEEKDLRLSKLLQKGLKGNISPL